MKTQWGLYPPDIDWGLPLKRLAVNVSTGKGLANLDKRKKNLININYSTFSLCTSENSYKAMVKSVFEKCKGYDVLVVIENEPDNKNVISNTSTGRYINNLSWAKFVADDYGVEVAHGGVMAPTGNKILFDIIPKDEQRTFRAYINQKGLFIGSSSAVKSAFQELDFCAKNGIYGNYHSQGEYVYLSRVLDALQGYCPRFIGNEFAVRSNDVDEIAGIVKAVEGQVDYAILYNTSGKGERAQALNSAQEKVFLEMVK